MRNYEDITIDIVLLTVDVIRTSKPGDNYDEDIDWEV